MRIWLSFLLISMVPILAHAAPFERNINRRGGDFHSFFTNAGASGCRQACLRDWRCKAWTWVRPGFQGRWGKCWLKNRVTAPTADRRTISGTRYITDDPTDNPRACLGLLNSRAAHKAQSDKFMRLYKQFAAALNSARIAERGGRDEWQASRCHVGKWRNRRECLIALKKINDAKYKQRIYPAKLTRFRRMFHYYHKRYFHADIAYKKCARRR